MYQVGKKPLWVIKTLHWYYNADSVLVSVTAQYMLKHSIHVSFIIYSIMPKTSNERENGRLFLSFVWSKRK